MIGSIQYRDVPHSLQRSFATLHRAALATGVQTNVPALLGQVWLCTVPIWWVPPGAAAPECLPRVALLGPTSAAFGMMPERDGPLFGCGLWPLGWAEIVRADAGALANRAIDARVMWPDLCDAWDRGTAGEEGGDWDALETVARGLAAQAQASPNAAWIALIDEWLASTDGVEVLPARFGRSARQVARITTRTHGGPPRLIASKWRTLRAAAELGLTEPDGPFWQDRFSDQSHFIREFRRFVGETPQLFAKQPDRVSRRILADPWHVSSERPLALLKSGRRS